MVGIVIVSHSRALANGIVDLARQMGGEDVTIVAAGGVGEDPDALGTDATIVLEAIRAADSADGVLVLMDLGSALLSAEMAIEMLGDEVEGQVLLCEAPVVEGAVAAATAARIGRSLQEVAEEARGGAAAKAEHLGVAPVQQAATPTSGAGAPDVELHLTVTNRLGLHARPAARFVQTTGRFDADVDVTNVTTGRGPKSARSLNAIATLGVRQGHEIRVRASGPDSRAAIEALQALADDNFGDPADDRAPVAEQARAPREAAPGLLSGLPASSGVAVGPARRWLREKPVISDRNAVAPEAEWGSLQEAITKARREIEAARSRTLLRAGRDDAAIFDAHLLYLSDDALISPARRAIFEEGRTAEQAWDDAVEAVALEYRKLPDEYQRAREADVLEVGTAVLEQLVGSATPSIGPGVLVVPELGAGIAARLDPSVTVAIATARGGPTSHAAIVAVGMGIPAVVGLGEALLEIDEGTLLILDGDSGTVRVDPSDEVVAEHEETIAEIEKVRAAARAEAAEPAVTRDGHRIEVAANAGSIDDAAPVAASGAEGIGLFRTEFLFLRRSDAPTEDEQYKAYSQIASALRGAPLIVRTLDAGADKPVPYLGQAPEDNPFLGERGIRLALARPEVFAAQLRAIIRTAAEHPVKLMFPMVSSLQELRAARKLLDEQRVRLESEGVPVPANLEVGVMVEVPAAALLASRLAPEVDFFSIGTNDLSQYTMAADRGNERVARMADGLNPAVLQLVKSVVDAADLHNNWVGICGEIAGDPVATPVLVGLGVRELSMAVRAVPVVKRVIRSLDLTSAATTASEALGLDSAGAVRAMLSDTTGRDPR